MSYLLDASQALSERSDEVRSYVDGTRPFDGAAFVLARERLADGLAVAEKLMDQGVQLWPTYAEAKAVAEAAASFRFEMPASSSMLVGGVVGFGLAWLALHWMSTRRSS